MHKGRQLRIGKVTQHCELHTSNIDAGSSSQKDQFLSMAGLLTNNVVVICPHEELYQSIESQLRTHAVEMGLAAGMKWYQSLLARCIERDAQPDCSDSSSHSEVEEWRDFCQECITVVILRELLYNVAPLKVECKTEEEVKKIEAIVRVAALKAARPAPLAIEELKKEGSCYLLPTGCLLKYNTYVHCEAEQLLQCYNTALAECQNNRAAATAKFSSLHITCNRLDAAVTPVHAEFEECKQKWLAFCSQCIQLCMLRHALYKVYGCDPCQAVIEALEQAHRVPAPRRRLKRPSLQSQPSTLQVAVSNASDTQSPLTANATADQTDHRSEFLSMSGILTRNILVNCPEEAEDIHNVMEMCMAAMQDGDAASIANYQNLVAKCIAKDSQLDRSDSIAPGKAKEWQDFCLECMRLALLRDKLYKVPPHSIECKDEEEVRLKEAELRTAVLKSAHLAPLAIEDLEEQDGCVKLPMGCLLRWNTLQLASQASAVHLAVDDTPDTLSPLAAEIVVVMDGISTTPHGDNSFICEVRDNKVYMMSKQLPNDVEGPVSDVMLTLHVVGLLEGDMEVTVSDNDLILAFEGAQLAVGTGSYYASIRDDVLAVNIEQLANLELIGVHGVSKKFKENLLRFLFMKQLKHNIPVIARLQTRVAVSKTPTSVGNHIVSQLKQNPRNKSVTPANDANKPPEGTSLDGTMVLSSVGGHAEGQPDQKALVHSMTIVDVDSRTERQLEQETLHSCLMLSDVNNNANRPLGKHLPSPSVIPDDDRNNAERLLTQDTLHCISMPPGIVDNADRPHDHDGLNTHAAPADIDSNANSPFELKALNTNMTAADSEVDASRPREENALSYSTMPSDTHNTSDKQFQQNVVSPRTDVADNADKQPPSYNGNATHGVNAVGHVLLLLLLLLLMYCLIMR